MIGKCGQCKRKFEYEAGSGGRRRTVCPGCRERNKTRAVMAVRDRLRRLPSEEAAEDNNPALAAVMKCTREEAALVLGLPSHAVRRLERTALYKIRRNPKAREFFRQYLEAGAPDLGLDEEATKLGEVLLDYLLKVSEWYRLQEACVEAGLEQEAEEALGEISKLQGAIGGALG